MSDRVWERANSDIQNNWIFMKFWDIFGEIIFLKKQMRSKLFQWMCLIRCVVCVCVRGKKVDMIVSERDKEWNEKNILFYIEKIWNLTYLLCHIFSLWSSLAFWDKKIKILLNYSENVS